uniref:2-oxoglutarate and iron dependent oxygenase domain containing 2 n=1 Tax=Nothoprocta perdicaria TaxID=30464 RepID=A0A8C6ZS30_NOTPE
MSAARPFLSCACFFSENVFVGRYGLHVRYRDERQLRRDHGRALRERGCRSPRDFAELLREVTSGGGGGGGGEGGGSGGGSGPPPRALCDRQVLFSPLFSPPNSISLLPTEKRICRLPVFTEEFCQAFVDELENFEQSDMPKGRPNSMNNYGVLLNELGMDETFITPLREKYLRPITALLYPDLGGACLDSHKAFVVKYSLHEDLDLSSHYDNAEVTLNVSLGKEFTEGNLYFGEFRQDPNPVPRYLEIEHVRTQGLLHRGGHIHGALPIASGERWNLIVWMRSSAIRNQLCPMCNKKPELVEAEGFGDGFTGTLEDAAPETVNLCSLW